MPVKKKETVAQRAARRKKKLEMGYTFKKGGKTLFRKKAPKTRAKSDWTIPTSVGEKLNKASKVITEVSKKIPPRPKSTRSAGRKKVQRKR